MNSSCRISAVNTGRPYIPLTAIPDGSITVDDRILLGHSYVGFWIGPNSATGDITISPVTLSAVINIETVNVGARTGWVLPNQATSTALAGSDSTDWTNPQYAKLVDNRLAYRASISAGAYTKYLRVYNFNLSIPTNTQIKGVYVRVARKKDSTAGDIADKAIRLVKNDGGGNPTVIGDNKAALVTVWDDDVSRTYYGGYADDWNASLTPTIVNDAVFGVALSANNIDSVAGSAYVDEIAINIAYWNEATASLTITAPTIVGVGEVVNQGELTISALTLSGIANFKLIDALVTLTAPISTLSGQAFTGIVQATGALSIMPVTTSSSPDVITAATGALTISNITTAGTGDTPVVATGALVSPFPYNGTESEETPIIQGWAMIGQSYDNTGLPIPQVNSYQYQPKPGYTETAMDLGVSRYRRNSTTEPGSLPTGLPRIPTFANIRFLLTADQFALWDGWHYWYAHDYCDWVIMMMSTGQGASKHWIRYVEWSASPVHTTDIWEVTATVELFERNVLP